MNILLIDCALGALPGHTVRSIRLKKGGIVPVERLLKDPSAEGGRFRPDVLLQKEKLGPRVFLRNLSELDCPKIFWAIDSHLNLFWHRLYAQLFDVVLTPHKSLFDALPPSWRHYDVRTFTEPGCARKWRPHAARGHAASFVGRIDANRPQRSRFARLLQDRHGVVPCALPFGDMLDLYEDTRVLPNESICREFNFRIMEGASCGCCVLTEDIGEDLSVNFEPGKEVLTYRNSLEFEELFSFASTRPSFTEKIGRAAMHRVVNCHLPDRRRDFFLEMLPTLTPRARSSSETELIFALAFIQWARAHPLQEKYSSSMQDVLERSVHPEAMAMKLRLLVENARREEAHALLKTLLDERGPASSADEDGLFDLHTACAAAALRLGDMPSFALCWNREKHRHPDARMPDTPFHACLAWASLLAVTGRICQPGFQFDPLRHCPETAFEMTRMAQQWITDSPDAHEWVKAMAKCCDESPFPHLGLKYQAQLSLDSAKDWRAGLAYATVCLDAFLLEDGLKEAAIARELARKSGEEEAFRRAAGESLFRLL